MRNHQDTGYVNGISPGTSVVWCSAQKNLGFHLVRNAIGPGPSLRLFQTWGRRNTETETNFLGLSQDSRVSKICLCV